MRGCILALDPAQQMRIGRTERALRQAGVAFEIIESRDDLIARISAASEPLLLIEAGAWFVENAPLSPIPASAMGRPLIAFGMVRNASHSSAERWRDAIRKRGGDLDRGSLSDEKLPPPICAYLEPDAAKEFGALLKVERDADAAWQRLLSGKEFRKVHLPALDVHECEGMRVLQVITSIQLGGAERVTLDLAEELSRRGVAVAVAALGRPTRESFPEPPDFYDLWRTPRDAGARADAIADAARDFGADLIHGHLITADEARAIREREFPLVMTLHNMPEGWPAGIDAQSVPADLILACSRAVEECVKATPVRTVWNGIEPGVPTRSGMRERFGWSAEDFVIVAIGNPRRQKRLDRLPAIVAKLQQRLAPRRARLLIAGAPARGSADGEQAAAALAKAIADSPAHAGIQWPGAVREIGDVLATGDVLISVSAHEGLSLAHLESLAAGVPVLATDVGGTREVAGIQLLPADAADDAIADALVKIAASPRSAALPPSFTRREMAARTHWLYPRVLTRSRPARDGLWLVTNNFSTGGAQSSARRLLLGLAKRGVKVGAAVVEEHPSHPTHGREMLMRAGIPVLAVPPPGTLDAPEAAARVLAAIDADRPRAVLFWNLIPVFKILIADALLDTPIFDVSPGEMYFASLSRYFANPRAGLPYRCAREYGARLAGAVVKYSAESQQAATTLGAPVHVIRNGVTLDQMPRRDRGDGLLIIGTAARLSPDKRIRDLIDAMHLAAPRLPRFTLRIAGGPERGFEAHADELRERARGLPVEWCGELGDTSEFLRGLDLFVMISEPSGCPNASLEAMAAGVPVIATDVGGAAEQIENGVSGILTPRRDASALSDAIIQLAHDQLRSEAFSKAARERIAAEFSLERMISAYAQMCAL